MFMLFCAALLIAAEDAAPVTSPNVAAPIEVAPTENLADYYGFAPLEVYDLDWRTFGIAAGDFNGDGRTDLAVIDNRRSQIELFLQQDEGREKEPVGVNDLVDPGRMKRTPVLVDRYVNSLAVGDFDGDGLDDLATLEDPGRLAIRLQTENGFSLQPDIRVSDAGEEQLDLAADDLDGDGDADIVVLGTQNTHVFMSNGKDGFAKDLELVNTSGDLNMLQLSDIDGDGRTDLFYTATDPTGSFFALRRRIGDRLTFGPEMRLLEDEFRAIALGEVDGKPGEEIFAIDGQTGRVEMLGFATEESDGEVPLSGRLTQYGLTGGRQDRRACFGDFNGDGQPDLAVSSPSAAEVILMLGDAGGFQPARVCPSLLDITSIHAGRFGGGEADSLVVLSDDEKSLGVSTFDPETGRLTFPTLLPIENLPNAVVPLRPDRGDESGFIAFGDEGGTLWSLTDGDWSADGPFPLPASVKASEIERVHRLDADGDQKTDFLLVFRRDSPTLITLNEEKAFVKLDVAGGLQLPRISGPMLSVTNNGQAVLIAQEKFIREVRLGDGNRWAVARQWNAPSAEVDLESVVPIEAGNSDDSVPAIAAFDSEAGQVLVFDGGEKSSPLAELEVGPFSLQQMLSADVDGDGHRDVVLVGPESVGLLSSRGEEPTLRTKLTYELDDDKAFAADLIVGDINADGKQDLIINEVRQHTAAIVALQEVEDAAEGDESLEAELAVRFTLFEEKRFSSSREQPGLQPREMLLADVTGDGRLDFILLAHDRLLIHPQDAPEKKAPAKDATTTDSSEQQSDSE